MAVRLPYSGNLFKGQQPKRLTLFVIGRFLEVFSALRAHVHGRE
jgi:hypothetical protein